MKTVSMKDQMPYANPADFHWKPKETLPAGAFAANVFGDPQKGNYAFFGKFPAKYAVPLHWHTNDCRVVIMKGSMTINAENASVVEIKEGGFFMLPAGMRYAVHTPNECVFLVWGSKPFDIVYADPKDDPRNR